MERACHVPRVFGGRVNEETPVDDPPNARRRATKRRHPVRLGRQPPHCDIEAGGLAETGRYADLLRPLLLFDDVVGKARLPRERVAPVDGTIELGEGG